MARSGAAGLGGRSTVAGRVRATLESEVETAAKVLIGLAGLLALVGVALLVASKLGLERLPGDIVIKRDGFTFYAPLGLMILISVIATIVINLLARR
jgi:hypothetical protein